jgi:bacillithiol biosynthesis cysteine-adding enzyme BshC
MQFSAHTLPYSLTNSFSPIVLDYLSGAPALNAFYNAKPSAEGIQQAIHQKQQHTIDRELLVSRLQHQYAAVGAAPAVTENIQQLLSPNTYTVCTAHQPNLFTGPLYFIYKILHAIKLAAALKEEHPQLHFVPVYYMGCEDADLDELNHFTVQGKKYVWQTTQKGAVGRMQADAALEQLILELAGQMAPLSFGNELMDMLRHYFNKGARVQDATFGLVHELFGRYGLVVLVPDDADLKRCMTEVFRQELFQPISSQLVAATSEQLSAQYNVQAHPRDINLFYLEDGIRERIIRTEGGFSVNNTTLSFSDAEMNTLLLEHPERFSPNVILRGLFQEMILPNIAFIGGGGELAYWLQLKSLFDHYRVPFPVLVLRNSFALVTVQQAAKIGRLDFTLFDFFNSDQHLLEQFARRQAQHPLSLNGKLEQAIYLFDAIKEQATTVDPTLGKHVAALQAASVKKLKELEKKMLRAEKRKHADAGRQIQNLRQQLFPGGALQERAESFLYYYGQMGPRFIDALYQHSGALQQEFTILQLHADISGEALT